ncbi:Holliday junction branch migration protein RuvA [Guyparkeria halopsychrophila]|uniref:Holliday junction branch migration protein RuvA n=1 Tax=Guyparkeria halopsychrophila TaxID=3139421 RepID=UPI0037CB9362
MIGRLAGRVLMRKPPFLLVDVQGIGYEVEAPMSTFFATQGQDDVILHTHLVVREDAQLLYGFATIRERDLFRALIKVSGIGPRMAVAVLSGMSEAQFRDCVLNDDVTALTKVPGIGKKTAERLIIEMRDRLDKQPGGGVPAVAGGEPAVATPRDEALSALEALGYKPAEAGRMIARAEKEGADNAESLIRLALRQTVKPSS